MSDTDDQFQEFGKSVRAFLQGLLGVGEAAGRRPPDKSFPKGDIERNKEAVLKMTEAFNNPSKDYREHAARVVPELLADDYEETWTFPLDRESDEPLERLPPAERIQAEIHLVRTAFPDAHYAVKELVAEGDTVILLWEFTGTHEGSFFGRQPTGRALKVTGFEVVRFDDKGEMVGHYDNHQQTSMDVLAQVGFLDAETLEEFGLPQIRR